MRNNTRKLLWAAVVTIPLGLAPAAWGQYRIGNDGRALDASNQVGSGGYNQPVRRSGVQVTPDDIVYGNVTAGREFRGRINTFDPREFRGRTGGAGADQFVRNTAGVPLPSAPRTDLSVPQPFLGESRAVQPPAEFSRVGFAGGYIPSDTAMRIEQDSRIGAPLRTRRVDGALTLPGGLDAQQQPTVLSGSPLYGIRQSPLTSDELTELGLAQPGARPFGQQQVAELRDELRRAAGEAGLEPQPREATPTPRLDRPFDAPQNQALDQRTGDQAQPSTALRADLQTSALARERLPSPAQQSTQYAELQRRMQTLRERTAQADQQRQATAQREQPGRATPQDRAAGLATRQPSQQTTGGLPPVPPAERAPTDQQATAQPPAARELPPPPPADYQPLQVKSLADGIKAEGLASIMTQAEEKMRAGRFLSALDDYDKAQQVAPNNAMVELGKGHALLGGSYFGRAEQSIRRAFMSEPALLLAQYDLKQMIGERRLQAIVEDLKLIARNEPNSAEPLILLAYIAYNTRNEGIAAGYLNEAANRARGDQLIPLMKRYWTFPAQGQPDQPELNK